MAIADYRADTPGDVDETVQVLPLTAAQRGMWFAESLSSEYSVNIAQYVDIRHAPGGLDVELFAQCCVDVGKLVESPFVRLTEIDGIPMQYVDVDFDQTVDILDFRSEPDPVAAATAWMQAEYRQPVDLLNDQFIIVSILLISDERTFWYNRAHHIIIDGYAALSIMRRTVDRYNALRRGEEPRDKAPATMAGIVEYEEAYQGSTRRETDRAHWLERVADLPERVTLSKAGSTGSLSFDNVVSSAALDPERQRRYETLAGELNSSLAVLMTSAFGAFLARMSNHDDIVLSLPVTGRATAKIKISGGMVSNILPIRLREVASRSVRELIQTAQLELTGALRHQRYRSDDIRRDAGLDQSSVSFGPTINMVFFDEQVAIDGTDMEYRILTSGILEDLLINLYQSSPGAPLVVDLHGNPHLYSPAELDALHGRFLTFLDRFLSDAALDIPVAEVGLLVDDDHRLLEALPQPRPRTSTATLVELFDEVATAHRHRGAVSDADGVTLSYAELASRSDAVARSLSARGIGAGDLVGVATARDTSLVVVMLAVLKAGAGYLPLDTGNPEERLRHIVDDAAPACLVVSDGDRPTWAGECAVVETGQLLAEAQTPEVAAAPVPRGPATPEATAYVIYTSGSTGAPKGVEIVHRNVATLLEAAAADFDFTPEDVWSVFHSYAFDFSVWEIFGPLLTGGRAVIVDRMVARAPAEFLQLLADEQITVASLTPSAFSIVADVRRRTGTSLALRYIVFGGEELRFDEVHNWYESFGDEIELVNMYGITETTVHVTYRPLDPDLVRGESASLIGRPLNSLGLRVLDNRLQPVPEGAVGEIYVVGEQLARGYRNRRGLTATRFVADLNGTGERMYRSGDLGRRIGTDVQYLGRADTQVQLRGFRVELGEVETALRAVDGVAASAAVVTDAASAGGAKLIGYAVVETDCGLDESAIREQVRAHVPGYMVPDVVMLIDELPLTANGKLNRQALPAPVFARDERVAYVAPSTPREREVVAIVEELLDIEPIGLQDNIFALGADSLTAARLASRLRTVAGLDIKLANVFESQSLGDIIGVATPVADDAATRRPELVPQPRPDRIPLAFSQRRLWFINRLDPTSAAYNIPGAVRLGADVDAAALAAAIDDVIARHEPLRTTFPDEDGETYQFIHSAEAAAAARLFDVVDVAPVDTERRLADFAVTGFDLNYEYPVRARLFRAVAPDGTLDHVLIVVMHHIVGDGASLGPLITDVLTAYGARLARREPAWRPLPVQYADYALWQREVLGDATDETSLMSAQVDFWRTELSGMPELISLPTDRARPIRPSGAGGYVDTLLDAETVARLHAVAAQHGVTVFAIFHAALAVVLSRLSGSDDVAIGTAIAGRDEPELTELIGMFVNTLVLRTRVHPDTDLTKLLNEANHTRAQALSNADVPFEQVVDAVGARRSTAHSPLFQVELVMQHDQVERLFEDEAGISLIDARAPFAKYDLSLSVVEYSDTGDHAGQISVAFGYARDLFDEPTVERFAGYLHDVLAAIAGSLETDDAGRSLRVDDLFAFPETEVDTVRAWSRGAPRELTAPDLASALLAGYRQDPDAVALVFADRDLTYAEFASRASALARRLVDDGVGPDVAVAVCIPRSVELLVAVHAIVLAGGQYVPLDTEAPVDRADYMLETAGTRRVLVGPGPRPAVVDDLADRVTVTVVDASAEADAQVEVFAPGERRVPLGPENAAYTIFTSGSTGRPKGVVVSHRAIVNRLDWMQEHYTLTQRDVVLQKTPVTFDVSVWELFWPFISGSRLVVAVPGGHGDPSYLVDIIQGEDVTTLHFVPSMLSTFLDVVGADRLAELSSLRQVFTSGEALTASTAGGLRTALPAVGLHNLYGPTEAAVDVTEHNVRGSETVVPIGRPVPNTTIHILDHRLRPLPVGVPGEIYLGGVQLARGYVSQGRLSAERFVADPYGPAGSRLYRTGDLGKWSPVGEIEYLGRNDFQVKLRGQRLELGEIESALMSVPGIVHTAVTVADLASGQSLVAYYSPDSVTPADAQSHLNGTVPEFMVPTIWMPLATMPLNSAGKVDRKALPAPVIETAEFVPASTETERVIARVFADVLGVDRISVAESFFDLGGNSLSATKVAARLSADLEVDIPVAAVFDAPSVRAMATFASDHGTPSRRPRLAARTHGDRAPLSAVQRGMWLINRADPASPAYNVAMALRLSGQLDTDAIGGAIEDLIDRHESMRTRYPLVDGEPMQVVLDRDAALDLLERSVVDVDGDPVPVIAEFTGRGFDVTVAPPLRMTLLRLTDTEHILVFVVHHITADGASMLPLATDVMTAYSARVSGRRPEWAPLAVQYLDYTLWQQESLAVTGPDGTTEADRQLAYWADRLRNAPARLELPTDRPRPRTPSFIGDEVRFDIDGGLVRKLEAVARQHNATLFMVMQTALVVLLSRLTTQRDIVIGTPFAGRGQPELDGVVGMFVNTLALRSRLQDEEKFAELLQRVRDEDLADMANAEIAFDTIVSSVLSSPPTSYNPIYQVMFAYQNFTIPSLDMDSMTISPVSEQLTPAKVDLQLTLFPDDFGAPAAKDADSMTGQLIYAADIFTKSTVETYAQRYLRVLEEVSENPQVLVGDIDIATAAEQVAADEIAGAELAVALPDLVARATAAAPDAVAAAHQGAEVTFAVLSSISDAMAAALPDPDSALTTALMSLLPGLAVSGPDALGDVLGDLRTNALRTLDGAVSGGGSRGNEAVQSTKGMTQT
ncbi:amino acid adenylation domain-containing protein [Gordonia terrae]|uniref:Non-ribosomal peptide synthetase n=2 Tax=Gordonia terrae TaxID=2055 RepID=A0AAD0KFL6_9ACTN|nr:non-ribosomal peptide synthetase [Gordonia terrae]VTR11665.1 AMP-binding protein domain-containing protein [Clostridioides difficile]ANY24674.1 non-ribosomal peptide synthetase [Gordonia terrae]AWO85421.1 non-ribosomal peptide synthetase [Gordonia terrae]VTS59836.1 Dimodular nonribosomal peptide synthase [Gordonia terrae]GAB43682.1 putative non-ribosomal peptide synthetase [Gordonia terrae NBRC 100016]